MFGVTLRGYSWLYCAGIDFTEAEEGENLSGGEEALPGYSLGMLIASDVGLRSGDGCGRTRLMPVLSSGFDAAREGGVRLVPGNGEDGMVRSSEAEALERDRTACI